MKLAVLGGGGVRSPFLAKSLVLGAEATGITETVFMDINAQKLSLYGKIAKGIAARIAPTLRFSLTTDAEEALRDADYIITTIRAGDDDGRVFDERTALNLGVLGQETTGAGGFAMALRSVHVLRDYCELAKRVSKPNVEMFNFTNPSGLVTQALRTMGYERVYGVCDAPSGFFRQLKTMLGCETFTAECFGLNHLSWFSGFQADGEDVTDKILSHPRLYKDTEMRLFNPELIEMCEHFLPNEYLYFYYFRDRAVESVLKSDKTRGETIRDINAHMLKELQKIDIDNDFEAAFHCFMLHYAMREDSYFSIESGKQRAEKFPVPTVEEYIHQPDNGGYAAVALEFIQAQHTGCPVQMVLSVPNNGALDFLRAEDVCELSCTVDRDGVHPHKVNYVPEMQKNLICTVKQYENLTVEAIMTHNRQKAVQALTLHPLVCSYPLAEALVDAYAKQYQDYIGAWEK